MYMFININDIILKINLAYLDMDLQLHHYTYNGSGMH